MEESLMFRIKRFIIESRRVLKVTRKPTVTEFKTVVKITGLGMMIIGATGFIILLGKELFR